jgi:predicted nucleic acid-binding protein
MPLTPFRSNKVRPPPWLVRNAEVGSLLPAAAWHGYERARLESLGKPAPFTDGQIAAIAHANDLVLVTINVKDFPRFKGLQVTNWSKA